LPPLCWIAQWGTGTPFFLYLSFPIKCFKSEVLFSIYLSYLGPISPTFYVRSAFSLKDSKITKRHLFLHFWYLCPEKLLVNMLVKGEAPWSSGERWGLTIWATVLGRGFKSQRHLKTIWKRWTTWWQKNNENNKNSQTGQVTPKKKHF